MILLDGKSLSKKIIIELSNEVKKYTLLKHRKPHLAAILVGDNPASKTYVSAKERACRLDTHRNFCGLADLKIFKQKHCNDL